MLFLRASLNEKGVNTISNQTLKQSYFCLVFNLSLRHRFATEMKKIKITKKNDLYIRDAVNMSIW